MSSTALTRGRAQKEQPRHCSSGKGGLSPQSYSPRKAPSSVGWVTGHLPSAGPSSAQRGPHLCCGAGRVQAGKVPAQHLGYSWHLINASLSSFILLEPSCELGWRVGRQGPDRKTLRSLGHHGTWFQSLACCVAPNRETTFLGLAPACQAQDLVSGLGFTPYSPLCPPPIPHRT